MCGPLLFSGCDQVGDPILDPGGYTEAGETGDRACLCPARLFHYGEDPQKRGRCEDFGPIGRRS